MVVPRRPLSAVLAASLLLAGSALLAPVPTHAAGHGGARPEAGPLRPAWLGVGMDDAARSGSGAPASRGVVISHVVRGSPADAAGLRAGDRLARVGGVEVRDAAQVIRLVAARAPGERLALEIERAGARRGLQATLRENPGAESIARLEHVGSAAPALDGGLPIGRAPSSLAALRGQVVLLDFWATWCGPCRLVAPQLNALQARFGAQGLRVVGVTTDPVERAATFMELAGTKYPSLADPGGLVSRAYHVSSLPTLFVIDRRGVVREVFIGFDPARDAALDALVQGLLAEPDAPSSSSSSPPRDAGALEGGADAR
jgi:peroxiredoxin